MTCPDNSICVYSQIGAKSGGECIFQDPTIICPDGSRRQYLTKQYISNIKGDFFGEFREQQIYFDQSAFSCLSNKLDSDAILYISFGCVMFTGFIAVGIYALTQNKQQKKKK